MLDKSSGRTLSSRRELADEGGAKREWSARLSGRPLREHCPKSRMQLSAVLAVYNESEIQENRRSSLKKGGPCEARDAHETPARWLNPTN